MWFTLVWRGVWTARLNPMEACHISKRTRLRNLNTHAASDNSWKLILYAQTGCNHRGVRQHTWSMSAAHIHTLHSTKKCTTLKLLCSDTCSQITAVCSGKLLTLLTSLAGMDFNKLPLFGLARILSLEVFLNWILLDYVTGICCIVAWIAGPNLNKAWAVRPQEKYANNNGECSPLIDFIRTTKWAHLCHYFLACRPSNIHDAEKSNVTHGVRHWCAHGSR